MGRRTSRRQHLFVSAGLELAEDVRAGRAPAPRRIYIALGLGGSAAGLGLGCALGGLRTEIVGVRASSPGSVTAATLRAIHDETIAFIRAHDAEGWDLDPVYSGKALAALLDDIHSDPPGRGSGPLLFWNTMSSRAVAIADVPAAFRRFAR